MPWTFYDKSGNQKQVQTNPLLICDLTLGASQASFDTNTILGGNIPATFSHLRALLYVRGDFAATNQPLWLRLNNDATANYDYENLQASLTTPSSQEALGVSQFQAGSFTGSSAPASLFSQVTVDIHNYLGTVGNKTMSSKWSLKIGTASGNVFTGGAEGYWRSSAAINRITLLPGSGGNFIAGSRFSLYGMV